MIKIIFLGTSYAIPSSERNHTSVLLNYKGENILVDCGEGTQRQFRKAKLNPCKLTRILITHWHGDHVLGIPGILQTLSLNGYNKTLFIYGPKGTKYLMKQLVDIFNFKLNYKIKIEEISGKKRFFETDDFCIESESMTHGVLCNAYSFIKKGRIRIDKNKLKKNKLPQGAFLKKLKEGKNIVYEGKKYLAKNLTFKEQDKKISFVYDTSFNGKIKGFVNGSDLLICEATFDSELEEMAKKKKHLTAGQSGKIAKQSKSKKLILTHISERYSKNVSKLLKDAKKNFKNVSVANDFDVIKI
jgi:ribonuclease Z|tara:strand:- start:1548 stop:2447 length:900 start_codon:yes stop_codon:yes gene_type:complete